MSDYYSVLGIKHAAEADEVAKAYRRAALTYNPECATDDTMDKTELQRRFDLVSQAYVVLSNPKYRAVYDAYGDEGVRHGGTGSAGIPGGLDMESTDSAEVFRQFFGVDSPFQVLGGIDGLQSQQHHFFSTDAATDKSPPKADPIAVTLPVTLEDLHKGTVRTVSWTAAHTDRDGAVTPQIKSLDMRVPVGIEDGAVMTLNGKGHTAYMRSPGDVVVTVQVLPHPAYRREGDDLVATLEVTLVEALTGVVAPVRTIDGRELEVGIDEVVHPAYRKRVPGHGLHRANGDGRGFLVVECATKFPAYLNAEQKTELKRIFAAE